VREESTEAIGINLDQTIPTDASTSRVSDAMFLCPHGSCAIDSDQFASGAQNFVKESCFFRDGVPDTHKKSELWTRTFDDELERDSG
jgi:hypothetical protein